jgi:sigma-B regulation protein RsbU (phosphoserine phosphatase)
VEWLAVGVLLAVCRQHYLHEREHSLEPGDVLVMYTDGVTEAFDGDDRMFDRDRLQQVVLEHRHRSAQYIVDAVTAAVREFSGEREQADDLTMVVVKCAPDASRPSSIAVARPWTP